MYGYTRYSPPGHFTVPKPSHNDGFNYDGSNASGVVCLSDPSLLGFKTKVHVSRDCVSDHPKKLTSISTSFSDMTGGGMDDEMSLTDFAEELGVHVDALDTATFYLTTFARFCPRLGFFVGKPVPDFWPSLTEACRVH